MKSIQEMMAQLVEDRRKREKEIATERAKREEEIVGPQTRSRSNRK